MIKRQEELSHETGCPAILHIYARSVKAIESYLDFAENVWDGPLILDSADPNTRAVAAGLVSELGYADRAIYNSISIATDEAEAQAIRDSEIDSAIILAYSPIDSSPDKALQVLQTGGSSIDKGLLSFAEELGISNLLIDPGVLPMGSGAGNALRFTILAKARLGLPVGSGIHNAISAWQWLKTKEISIRKGCDTAAAAMQVLSGADFLLYGPIENADPIFHVAAMTDIMVAEAVKDLDITPISDHPLLRLV